MRSEKEILDLIIQAAQADPLIESAFLCGSRAVGSVEKDIYQDYDIEYYVKDIKPYFNNLSWLESLFGKILLIQTPNLMDDPSLSAETSDEFTYLSIFEDGVRIDLTIHSTPFEDNGEPTILLLDKTGRLEKSYGDESIYYAKKPSQTEFSHCCNEFWWCLNNVAKGIARSELPYAMEMLNSVVRPQLNNMVSWYIGTITDFSVSPGKMGKFFKNYLHESLYSRYLKSYTIAVPAKMWTAVIETCKLFSDLAGAVSGNLSLEYNKAEEKGLQIYLDMVRDGFNTNHQLSIG